LNNPVFTDVCKDGNAFIPSGRQFSWTSRHNDEYTVYIYQTIQQLESTADLI